MADDVLINKAATIERYIARAREEYAKGPESFAQDFTRQDAAVLNIERAFAAAMRMGERVMARDRLGSPPRASDVFGLLAEADRILQEQAEALRPVSEFYEEAGRAEPPPAPLVAGIITNRLDALTDFSGALLRRDAPP